MQMQRPRPYIPTRYTVAFFGHRRIENLDEIDAKLMPILERLITKYDYVDFLIGRSGEFDVYVASVIKRARWAYGVDNSDLILVLPYEVADIEDYWQYYDCVRIPDCLEGVHPKAAMAKRNRWMVEQADLVIVNVEREQGGAYRAERYAEKLGVPVVNLADDEPVGGRIRPNEK